MIVKSRHGYNVHAIDINKTHIKVRNTPAEARIMICDKNVSICSFTSKEFKKHRKKSREPFGILK